MSECWLNRAKESNAGSSHFKILSLPLSLSFLSIPCVNKEFRSERTTCEVEL